MRTIKLTHKNRLLKEVWPLPSYLLVISSILLGAVGQVLMKLGTSKLGLMAEQPLLRKLMLIFSHPNILEGLLCYGLSAVFWIFGLSRLPLSQAYPMVAIGYVIVFILAVFLFKETVTVYKISGLLFIIIGVIFLAKT